ncbi:MAG: ergothioneine biosynthesis protein EgtC [Cyanobacteria bacterium P01_E01_bin.34]
MCRIFGYLGQPIQLEHLLVKPDHSLIVQSYQPKELRNALLNADGFGIGWYHATQPEALPFLYKNVLPIWNDTNLPHLCRYVETHCTIANIRSATPGLAVDLGNTHPFTHDRLLFVHNGFIENFRHTLYRPIRNQLSDTAYQSIHGTTDSEHLFALLCDRLARTPGLSLTDALAETIQIVTDLAAPKSIPIYLNLMVTDGQQIAVSRYARQGPTPSLYWLRDDPSWSHSVAIASEPMFDGNWLPCNEASILTVDTDLEIDIRYL